MQPQTAPRNYQQEFHDELNQWQKETPYPLANLPNGALPPNFFNIVDDAIAFEIPVSLKVTEADFRRLHSLEGTEISLIDMGTILYVLEKRTRAEYMWEKEEYLQYRDMVSILTEEWRKCCEPKSKELKEKYNAMIEEEKKTIQSERTANIVDAKIVKSASQGKKSRAERKKLQQDFFDATTAKNAKAVK